MFIGLTGAGSTTRCEFANTFLGKWGKMRSVLTIDTELKR